MEAAVEHLEKHVMLVEKALDDRLLGQLADAAIATIHKNGGFGWLVAPSREAMVQYWQGALLVPERKLFIGHLGKRVAGSLQLIANHPNNQAQSRSIRLTGIFVAPWARRRGLAADLTRAAEDYARRENYLSIELDVRSTQGGAISHYEKMGYRRWGENPHYAFIDGHWIVGYYYSKLLF